MKLASRLIIMGSVGPVTMMKVERSAIGDFFFDKFGHLTKIGEFITIRLRTPIVVLTANSSQHPRTENANREK